MISWAANTLLEQNVLTVENWLEIAYHLCKQRWDQSIDWLETQPMSKIHTMIDIVKHHASEQEKAQKSAARRK
jgi:hypothetical protein